ncbi:DUF3718 domain-containing protein [Litorilituus sediminis]|uniref:DUF3718 domain-containing protein n=1 Tax=Litorilituus sediminis TaxID=718192 RepID=A0A4P6P8F6_9GAMM|nr:DUF3718 domain-containing protein [Litorilituus sediminis]QBG35737.1 DUF3718 domain-containing protein [Litorilituus sediminis]
MKTVKAAVLGITTTLSLLAISLPSQAAMSEHMEHALISVCKAAKSNKVHHFNKTTKAFRLKKKAVALKVVCNGEDIISFAESHSADKTAAHLQQSISEVQITDLAANSKLRIRF